MMMDGMGWPEWREWMGMGSEQQHPAASSSSRLPCHLWPCGCRLVQLGALLVLHPGGR